MTNKAYIWLIKASLMKTKTEYIRLLRQYMTMDIFYCVQEFLKKLKAEPPEVSESG